MYKTISKFNAAFVIKLTRGEFMLADLQMKDLVKELFDKTGSFFSR